MQLSIGSKVHLSTGSTASEAERKEDCSHSWGTSRLLDKRNYIRQPPAGEWWTKKTMSWSD